MVVLVCVVEPGVGTHNTPDLWLDQVVLVPGREATFQEVKGNLRSE